MFLFWPQSLRFLHRAIVVCGTRGKYKPTVMIGPFLPLWDRLRGCCWWWSENRNVAHVQHTCRTWTGKWSTRLVDVFQALHAFLRCLHWHTDTHTHTHTHKWVGPWHHSVCGFSQLTQQPSTFSDFLTSPTPRHTVITVTLTTTWIASTRS